MPAEPAARLRVRTEQSPEAVLVLPEGDVDTESYDVFRYALAEAAAAGRPRVVVDLAQVAYIDSMGLGALISGFRDANEAGCRLSLVSQNPHVRRVLHVTGLSRLLPVYQRRQEALDDGAMGFDA